MTDLVKAGLVVGGSLLAGPVGGLAGGLLGAALFPPKLPTQRGPKIGDQPVTTSAYGQMIAKTYGTITVAGNIIDAGGYKLNKKKKKSGGKGGPQQTTITYSETVSYDILLDANCDGIVQIFANEKLIYDARPAASVKRPKWLDFTFYDGALTQEPDPTFEAIHGAGEVSAYRGVSRVVFKDFLITEFGTSAINFRFLVTTNGTPSQSNLTYPHEGVNTWDVLWHEDSDLIIACVNFLEDSTPGATEQSILAIDPYSETIVWQYIETDPSNYFDSTFISFAALPRYANGFPVYQRNEFIAFESRLDDPVLTTLRVINFVYADSGQLYGRAAFPNSEGEPRFVSCYEDDAVFYYPRDGGAGTIQLYRVQVDSVLNSAQQSVAYPTGYVDPGNSVIAAAIGSKLEGRDSYIAIGIEDSATGTQYGVAVAKDTQPGAGAGTWTLDWNVGLFPATGAQLVDAVWDSINEQFWCVENIAIATVDRPRFYTLQTDGTIFGPIDWNTEFSITGSAGNGGGISEIRRALDFEEGSGLIYVVVDSVLYSFPVSDTTATPTQRGTSMEGSPIAFHPPTNSIFLGEDDAWVNQRKLERLTSGQTTLQAVCEDISDSVSIASADYAFSAFSGVTVDGFKIANIAPAKDSIDTLRKAYQFDIVPVNGVLTGVLRSATTSSATLTEDDIGAHAEGAQQPVPITITRKAENELPRQYEVGYIDIDHNYEIGWQRDIRLASGGGTTIQSEIAVVLDDDDGAQVASIELHAAHIEAEAYSFQALPTSWTDLQPAKIVTVVYDGVSYPMRVIESSLTEGGIIDVKGVRADTSIYSNFSVGGTPRTHTNAIQGTGPTILFLLDIPSLRSADNDAGFYTAAVSYTPNWTGAELYTSTDGGNYAAQYTQDSESTAGYAVDSLSEAVAGLIDYDTLDVTLVNGSLASLTAAQILTDSVENYAAYGTAGRWEIVRFLSVTQNANDTWTLTNFYRGLRGTEEYTDNHASGDAFVVLDQDTLGRLSLENADINQLLYTKGVTIGSTVTETAARTITPTGAALLPYPPVALDAQLSAGDWTLTCSRQDRIKARFLQQPQMSESTEAYEIEILDAAGSVVNTYTSTTESYTYTSAQQTTDFGGALSYIKWAWNQQSSVVGDGHRAYGSAGSWEDYDSLVTGRGTLIDFWPCDDVSGAIASDSGSHDGTAGGTLTYESDVLTAGDGAKSLFFDSTDNVSMSYWAGLAGVKACEFWIKLNELPATDYAPVINHGDSSDGWFIAIKSDGILEWRGYNGTTFSAGFSTQTALTVGEIYHVACTFDIGASSALKIYLNGSLDNSGTAAGAWVRDPSTLLRVRVDNVTWTTDNAEMWLSKIALYDTELTAAEVYSAAIAGYGT